jgi:hypothetical protein
VVSRHRAGEPITTAEARAETADLMADADRRRDQDTPEETLRLPPYVDRPAATPTDVAIPDGDKPDDRTQPVAVIQHGELAGDVRPLNRLDHAVRLLRARGRCVRRLVDARGCMCPVAALAAVSGISPSDVAALQKWLDVEPVGDPPTRAYEYVCGLPEAAHLVNVIRGSGTDWISRSELTAQAIWYWADHSTDDEVFGLLDEAADSYQAVAT